MSVPAGTRTEAFWYHGWNVLALGMLLQALTVGLLLYSFSFWVAPWTSEFGVTRGEALFAATLYSAVAGLAGPLVGPALDRLPMRLLVVAGLLAMALGLLLVSVASAFWQILLVYGALMPVAVSFAGPFAAQAMSVRWFPERRGLALGLTAMGTSVGGATLPVLVTYLVASVGWRAAHHVLAGVALALLPAAWWVLARNPRRLSPPTGAAAAREGGEGVSMLAIVRMPAFWVLVVMFTPMYFLVTGFQYNIAPLAGDAGLDAAAAAMAVSTMAVAMIVGKLGFGWLMDRIEHRWVFALAAVGMAASLWLVTVVPPELLVAVVAALGLFIGGVLPIKGTMVAHTFGGSHYGRAVGLMSPLLMTSSLAPVLVGWLRDFTGSYGAVFLGLALAVLPGVVLAFWFAGRRP